MPQKAEDIRKRLQEEPPRPLQRDIRPHVIQRDPVPPRHDDEHRRPDQFWDE